MPFRIILTDDNQDDFGKLEKESPKPIAKVNQLMDNMRQTPFAGLGKPEPLKGNLSGHWSRKINNKHRLVYEVEGNNIFIESAYGHYNDK